MADLGDIGQTLATSAVHAAFGVPAVKTWPDIGQGLPPVTLGENIPAADNSYGGVA